MTEDQAKEKRCPFGQIAYQVYAGTGHSERQDCVASGCMMWRWEDDGKEYAFWDPHDDSWQYDPYNSGVDYSECKRWSRMRNNRTGYCGLAGKL